MGCGGSVEEIAACGSRSFWGPALPDLLVAGGGSFTAAVGLSFRFGWGGVLVVGDEIFDGNEIVAVRAWAARAQLAAPGVAVLAALDAEVAALAPPNRSPNSWRATPTSSTGHFSTLPITGSTRIAFTPTNSS